MNNIYIYADESGVFDKDHNDLFSFGGLILTSRSIRDKQIQRYKQVERRVRNSLGEKAPDELKASLLSIEKRHQLFRAANIGTRFGAIVYQKNVHDEVFTHKKTKQRFLDYAFKRGLKHALVTLIKRGEISTTETTTLHVVMDEHTTATDGKYELGESIESEFVYGAFNPNYSKHFTPIMPNIQTVNIKFVDSVDYELVRASDIIANRLIWIAKTYQRYSDTGILIRKLP